MSQLHETDPMPFGKFKGRPMQDVPVNYLHYLWTHGIKQETDRPVGEYILRNLDALKQENEDLIWE